MQESFIALREWGDFSVITSTLFFVFYICFSNKQNSSLHLTSCIVIGFNLVMLVLEEPLMKIVDRDLARFLWYITFAALDTCVIAAIHIVHRTNKLKTTHFSKLMQFNYGALALLQYVTYWDQITFNLTLIDSLYRLAIPSISFAISALLIMTITKEFIVQVINYPELKEKQ